MTAAMPQPSATGWHNNLPAWIMVDERYERLVPSIRRTLQAIADKCDAPDQQGNLTGAFGGQSLVESAGCSVRSFWNHLARLEQLGFVATLGRGGTIGRRNYGNIYGIPGSRGSLDSRRARRRMQVMVDSGDGRLRPHIVEPGDQVMLWPTTKASGPASLGHHYRGPRAPKLHGGRAKLHGGGRAKLHTTIDPHGVPPDKNHGRDGACRPRPGGSARRTLPHTSIEDLRSPCRLLSLFDQAVRRGLVQGCDDDRLRFFAAAAHAIRCATSNAPGLFASVVNGGRWLHLTNGDEEVAAAWLRGLRDGPRTRQPQWRPPRQPAARLSHDARLLLAARKVAHDRRGAAGDPYRMLRLQDPSWTRDRYDAAQEEIDQRRSA